MRGPQRLLAFAGGFGAGVAGGLFGVGGGLVLIPILTGLFKLSQHQAHGTSLAVIGATALVSVIVYALHGNVAWGTAARPAGRFGWPWQNTFPVFALPAPSRRLRRTENPRVGASIPPLATTYNFLKRKSFRASPADYRCPRGAEID